MQVTSRDVAAISRLVEELCGIVLDETKDYLIESRLSALVRSASCQSFQELADKARRSDQAATRAAIVDAITTRETLFFRDEAPFEALQHRVLPDLIDARAKTATPRRLRIWSAACSAGQEPYSIAMTLCELLPDIHRWDVTILASDISDAAIRQASLGRYSDSATQRGLKPQLMAKYFLRDNGQWRVRDELRSLIRFERRNLLEPFTQLGPFEVIFCRNVAIYFGAADRRGLFERLADRLVVDGCLFAGSAESLIDLGPRFTPRRHCRCAYYQPNLPVNAPLAQVPCHAVRAR